MDVVHKLILRHLHVSYSHSQTQHLLHLEFDSGFDLVHLGVQVLIVGEQGGEFAGLVQPRTQDTRDLLDQRLRGQEGIVLLGELLDHFLVLVEFLESLNVHVWQLSDFGLVTMLLVSQDAHGELGPGESLQPDSAGETLVLLGIIVFQADLQLHRLRELPCLGLRTLQDLLHCFIQRIPADLTHFRTDIDEPVSDTCCSGCGAMLHCTAAAVPGYLPSEKYKALLEEERLSGATCQRCHLLTHHHKALNLHMTSDQYRAVVQRLRPLKALVLLVVDLLDVPDSIVPDLPELVGTNKHVVVLGNKIDLLPGDSPNYLQRIKRQLARYCQDAGFGGQVTDVHLISAKTGYGVEGLISSLQRSWKYKGDVYLVGSANAGKSTLFNTLLESDYCKSKASDVVHKATISPWPGTTLNLLKFPIINPTPYRMFKRRERLDASERQTESELSPDELKTLRQLSKQGYLVGRVGRTFRSVQSRRDVIEFDPDSLAFGENDDEETTTMKSAPSRSADEFTSNELKDAHWLFDTPGIMKEHDILDLLTEQEVMSVVPGQAVVPRTFVLKPGMSLFLGALARIDFLQGGKSCWFSVVASGRVPVHITSVEKADGVYEKHAGHILLGVPLGGSERMKTFPELVPQDFSVEGAGYLEAAADITLSSAGWVAVTAAAGDQVLLRVHGPAAAGFRLRTPPLLPHVVSLKGERIRKSAAYKPQKPPGLLDGGLSASGAERLLVKKKKKTK